jgi:phospholipid/cholesterol/gamma-HCH transport system substrate-binding protein
MQRAVDPHVERVPAMTKRLLAAIVTVAVVLGIGVVLIAQPFGHGPRITVTAHFSRTPGLYPGNHVKVLGVTVGSVDSVVAGPNDVTVRMSVDRDVAVPADARAVLLAPGVINDRFVELAPAYRGGARLTNGAVIPLSRTAIPLDTNQIYAALDNLLTALGPQGANKTGLVARTLHRLAATLRGNGAPTHRLIASLSTALSTVADQGPGVAHTPTGLNRLIGTLVTHDALYRRFAKDLATVTTALAHDGPKLSAALKSLSSTMTNVEAFVHDNRATLSSIVAHLRNTTRVIAERQRALIDVYNVGPLALKNFGDTVAAGYPGGPVDRIRYDAAGDRNLLLSQICGHGRPHLQRLGVYGFTSKQATSFDLACAALATLTQEPPPPGAPYGPDLSIAALVGADG